MALLIRASSAASSYVCPRSLATIIRWRSSGLTRLPTCVVSLRSVLRFISYLRLEIFSTRDETFSASPKVVLSGVRRGGVTEPHKTGFWGIRQEDRLLNCR